MIHYILMSITQSIKVRQAGGSLIATIPKEVVDAQGLRPGDRIQVTFLSRRQALEEFVGSLAELGPWDRAWTRGRDRY